MSLPILRKAPAFPERLAEDYYLGESEEIPNNLLLPLLVYRKILPPADLARAFEKTFANNGWRPAWRDGIYPFAHYHSNAHEVIGIFCGSATVLFGHTGGIEINLGPGDAIVLPAGTGHQCLFSSADFQAVGAYPEGSRPDLMRADAAEKPAAKVRIDLVPLPKLDPIFGAKGPVMDLW